MDGNTNLAQCLQPLLTALSSSSGISALTGICSATACDPNLIGGQLGQFYQACQNELTVSKDASVIVTYDALYILGPLQKALCQKNATGSYCLATSSSSTSTKRASLDRRSSTQQAFTLDATVFAQKNVAFLGLLPDLAADQLCVPCTREIMGIYTTQLGNIPYGPGLQNSQLMSDEPALYSAINSKCGASFLAGQVQAAGGLATGAAPRSVDGGLTLVGSALAAAAAGAVALL